MALPLMACRLGFWPSSQPSPLGLGLADPDKQVYPALQGPVGAVSPEPLQYIPGEHAEHCDMFVNPETLEKEPAGHAMGS